MSRLLPVEKRTPEITELEELRVESDHRHVVIGTCPAKKLHDTCTRDQDEVWQR